MWYPFLFLCLFVSIDINGCLSTDITSSIDTQTASYVKSTFKKAGIDATFDRLVDHVTNDLETVIISSDGEIAAINEPTPSNHDAKVVFNVVMETNVYNINMEQEFIDIQSGSDITSQPTTDDIQKMMTVTAVDKQLANQVPITQSSHSNSIPTNSPSKTIEKRNKDAVALVSPRSLLPKKPVSRKKPHINPALISSPPMETSCKYSFNNFMDSMIKVMYFLILLAIFVIILMIGIIIYLKFLEPYRKNIIWKHNKYTFNPINKYDDEGSQNEQQINMGNYSMNSIRRAKIKNNDIINETLMGIGYTI